MRTVVELATGEPARPVDEVGPEVEQRVVVHLERRPAPAPVLSSRSQIELAVGRRVRHGRAGHPRSKRRLNPIHGGRRQRGDRGRAARRRARAASPRAPGPRPPPRPGVGEVVADGRGEHDGVGRDPVEQRRRRSVCAATGVTGGPGDAARGTAVGRDRRPRPVARPATRSSAGRYPSSARRPHPTIPTRNRVGHSTLASSATAPGASRDASRRARDQSGRDAHRDRRRRRRDDGSCGGRRQRPRARSPGGASEQCVERAVERAPGPRARPRATNRRSRATLPTTAPTLAAALSRWRQPEVQDRGTGAERHMQRDPRDTAAAKSVQIIERRVHAFRCVPWMVGSSRIGSPASTRRRPRSMSSTDGCG